MDQPTQEQKQEQANSPIEVAAPVQPATPPIKPVPFERPVERPFLSQIPKANKIDWQQHSSKILGVAAICVLGAGAFLFQNKFTQPSAPKIDLTTAPSTSEPSPVVPASAPMAPPALASSEPAAAASAPVHASSAAASDANGEQIITEEKGGDAGLSMNAQVEQLTIELQASKDLVVALKKQLHGAPRKVATPQPTPEEFFALTILEINRNAVVVSESGKQSTVEPGALLPGGATFIGFDASSRLMKTDRGDFLIK